MWRGVGRADSRCSALVDDYRQNPAWICAALAPDLANLEHLAYVSPAERGPLSALGVVSLGRAPLSPMCRQRDDTHGGGRPFACGAWAIRHLLPLGETAAPGERSGRVAPLSRERGVGGEVNMANSWRERGG